MVSSHQKMSGDLMPLLATLSEQERQMVRHQNTAEKNPEQDDPPIWADEAVCAVYSHFPENGELIDVGCGYGRAIEMLQGMGIKRYLGIDPSERAVSYCREKYPEQHFELEEIRSIGPKYPDRFDGFLMICVLIHLPRAEVVPALQAFRKCLKKGAVGLFSVPLGQGTFTGPDQITVTLFELQEIRGFFSQAGFDVFFAHIPYGDMIIGGARAV